MAIVAHMKYCATYIQAIYRGFLARKYLSRLFAKRFIQDWLFFRWRSRKRYRAIVLIQTKFRIYFTFLQRRREISWRLAACKIQEMYRSIYKRRRALIRCSAFRVSSHALLFGMTKAARKIVGSRKILSRMITRFIRKKRLLRCYHYSVMPFRLICPNI
jgi:hypothetical protein